jgi:hypothetical protein
MAGDVHPSISEVEERDDAYEPDVQNDAVIVDLLRYVGGLTPNSSSLLRKRMQAGFRFASMGWGWTTVVLQQIQVCTRIALAPSRHSLVPDVSYPHPHLTNASCELHRPYVDSRELHRP